jgi:cyclopropane fatty-acyl-phospholipid synthase-like methyltransferase
MQLFLRIGLSTIAVFAYLGVATAQQPPAKPDHMQHRFDDPERYAKSFDDPARDAWQMPARVIEALALARDARVADIGAGTGYFTVRLAKAIPNGTVFAVDIQPEMVGYLQKRVETEQLSNVTTVLADAVSANLPKPVDAMLIVDTYHHIPNRRGYFSGLKKSLTPAGKVAIVDFKKDAPAGPPREFRFEADEIIAEMTQAGYTLDARHDFLPRQHFLIFRPATAR